MTYHQALAAAFIQATYYANGTAVIPWSHNPDIRWSSKASALAWTRLLTQREA